MDQLNERIINADGIYITSVINIIFDHFCFIINKVG